MIKTGGEYMAYLGKIFFWSSLLMACLNGIAAIFNDEYTAMAAWHFATAAFWKDHA